MQFELSLINSIVGIKVLSFFPLQSRLLFPKPDRITHRILADRIGWRVWKPPLLVDGTHVYVGWRAQLGQNRPALPVGQQHGAGHGHESLSSAYAQLGLSADATLDEVKGAYRKLALQCHPDLNKKDGQEFVRITAAYQRIMNKSVGYSPSDSSRRHYEPAVYASSNTRFTPRAAAVWGFGLAMGCVFFGTVLLWARTELMHGSYQRKGPSRVVEPSSNSLKRERIAALLLERQKAKDREEGK